MHVLATKVKLVQPDEKHSLKHKHFLFRHMWIPETAIELLTLCQCFYVGIMVLMFCRYAVKEGVGEIIIAQLIPPVIIFLFVYPKLVYKFGLLSAIVDPSEERIQLIVEHMERISSLAEKFVVSLLEKLNEHSTDPEKQREEIEACFRAHDADGSGKLDKKELKQALKDLLGEDAKEVLKSKDFGCFFSCLDSDQSGTVDLDEFLDFVYSMVHSTKKRPKSVAARRSVRPLSQAPDRDQTGPRIVDDSDSA